MIIFVIDMKNLFLAILSGLFFAFSWPGIGLFPILFFAFIPLLIVEERLRNSNDKEKGRKVFWLSFLVFFIFNAITTYWIYHATFFGAVAAFLVNATLMAMAFYLFHKTRERTNNRLGYLAFVFLWISMEYLHLSWELSWPWLTLGNGFANVPNMVQWYEFTGFLGGSVWVLLINILLFRLAKDQTFKTILLPFLLLILPLLFSYNVIPDLKSEDQLNVLIIQPNIDPYTDKFNIGFEKQLDNFVALAKTELNQETDLLVGPETTLLEDIWENKDNRYDKTYSINVLKDLQAEYPNLNILVGATTFRLFGDKEKKSPTARQIRNENIFYDVYNSAIFIPDSGLIEIYHKTKLVPGVEKMPFPKLLDPLAKLAVELGGTTGSLASKNTIRNFSINNKKIQPLICYESIYGDLQKEKINLIAIITNDGWWKNSAGYKQHFSYASLRAIEQRKTIVRSANTGISGVIDAKGEILQKTKWDEEICITAKVNLNSQTTFYGQFGNYIGRVSVFISILILIIAFVNGRLKKIKNPL